MPNKKMTLKICGLIVLWIIIAQGQFKESYKGQQILFMPTGNLHSDFILQTEQNLSLSHLDTITNIPQNKVYSPLTAGLYSAIVPGAGQFYAKSYWQSTAFFGTEVLMWVLYATYESKGDRQTNDFQQYADANWSAVRYAYWIRDNFPSFYEQDIVVGNPPPNISQPWNFINWDNLNKVEDQIGQQATSDQPTGFTHQLPHRPEQQYYELIGKYPQFGGGWDDASTFKPGGFTKDDILISNVSPNFLKYSHMRGDANSFYNIATTASYVLVANHILSALEAAWNASVKNHELHLQGHIKSRVIFEDIVEFVPTVDLEIGF